MRIALLFSVVLAACGGSSPPSPSSPAATRTKLFDPVTHDSVVDGVQITLEAPPGWEVTSTVNELGFVEVVAGIDVDRPHAPMFVISAGLPTSVATMDELIAQSGLEGVTPVVESPRTRTYVTSMTNDDGSTSRIAGIFHEVAGQKVYIRLSFLALPDEFDQLGGLDFLRAIASGMQRPYDVRGSLP